MTVELLDHIFFFFFTFSANICFGIFGNALVLSSKYIFYILFFRVFIVRSYRREIRERRGGERGMTHVYDDPPRSWYLVFEHLIVFVVLIILPVPNKKTCQKYILITLIFISTNIKN